MIENHMVLNVSYAPWNTLDDTRPREECMICRRVMVSSNKDWRTDWITEDGRPLECAREVPGGLVCGKACASQALFDSLGDERRRQLHRCLAAMSELWSALLSFGIKGAGSPLVPYVEVAAFGQLRDRNADALFLLLGDSNEDAPAWTEGKL